MAVESAEIDIRDFSFSYPNGTRVLGPVDWQVNTGSFCLLVGSTGSGKTTLLRCLKPAIAPKGTTTGSMLVMGQDIAEQSDRQQVQTVGYVSQSPENQLICDTVWHELAFGLENLGFVQDDMHRRIAEVAHFFGIEPWFHKAVADLSGGQKQIVTLAGVLALRPRVLLLDEPTSQLDPVAEKTFLHALFRLNRELGITVVVATHTPETMVDYATDAVRLHNGVLSPANPEDFAAAPINNKTVAALRAQTMACAPQEAAQAAVDVSDAYVRYDRKANWVLRGMNLRAQQGGIHALVGGNGCGKSTLLAAITTTLKVERGKVVNAFCKQQMFLPQDPKALFVCDTVFEELTEWQGACGYDDAQVHEMLERFGMANHSEHHPFDLSGGQQQLLALAKVLLVRPRLLLLDEPTKGLDAQTKYDVAQSLLEQADGGTTIVMATHDLAFALLVSHRSTMLFDGQAACSQPTDQLFADNLFYRPVQDAFFVLWQNKAIAEGVCIEDEVCVGGTESSASDD